VPAIEQSVDNTATLLSGGIGTLARALRGDAISDGLVVCETRHGLGMLASDLATLSSLPEMHDNPATDWVYIDTETTGLSGGVGTLAFMVGVARYLSDGMLSVRQYALSRFADEALMLRDLTSWIGENATLCSFNGRCFDLPLLTNRFRLHRQRCVVAKLPHLDLMYGVRRTYRQQWPDCRLQTAEKRRLGIRRINDMPGALAPQAWQKWLGEGDPSMLIEVLAHNRQDVVSLAKLHLALVRDHAAASHPESDPGAIGLAWYKVGCVDRAMALWERHADRLDASASLQQAAAYRRAERWQEAESVWLKLYEQGNRDAALALSKYYEHRRQDYRQAMRFAVASGESDDGTRQQRLRRKLGAAPETRQSRMRNLELPLLSQPTNDHSDLNRSRRI
jgi:uncharacterized protein YprB with RNaseH-like and TPR domain